MRKCISLILCLLITAGLSAWAETPAVFAFDMIGTKAEAPGAGLPVPEVEAPGTSLPALTVEAPGTGLPAPAAEALWSGLPAPAPESAGIAGTSAEIPQAGIIGPAAVSAREAAADGLASVQSVPEAAVPDTFRVNAGRIYDAGAQADGELRGVWFAYYDWEAMPREEEAFRQAAASVMDRLRELGMNAVFLHVHSHSDSYYLRSSYFPASLYAFGTMGEPLSFDPLAIMIEEAHARQISVHAWLNPYRITSNSEERTNVTWQDIPEDSLVRQWRNSPEHERSILKYNDLYFLNPAREEVKQLLTDTITELVSEYSVDGVHFDDYFYPSINSGYEGSAFDTPEYEASGSDLSLADWRRENVTDLLRRIHAAVREVDPRLVFGVSPAGNLDNLRSSSMYFTDIDGWLAAEGCVDYIMPQLYWGFEASDGSGGRASWAFENNLSRWMGLDRADGIALYIGLPLFRTGSDTTFKGNESEWYSSDDIIARMIRCCREQEAVEGFVIFDYEDLNRPGAAAETDSGGGEPPANELRAGEPELANRAAKDLTQTTLKQNQSRTNGTNNS